MPISEKNNFININIYYFNIMILSNKKILLAAAVVAVGTSFAVAKGKNKKVDWAQFYRYEEANKLPEAHKAAVVFMGNSITDNWAMRDSAFFADNNYVGRGISGQTSSEMLVRFRRDVIDLEPRVVVILAGTNDVAENNGKIKLENTLGNIKSMCELARAHKIVPVLCSVLPCDLFQWRQEVQPAEKIKQLNDMIRQYAAKEKIAYVDYHSAMANPDGAMIDSLTYDHCHPSAAGYRVMESVIQPILKKALKKAKK